MGHLAKYGFAIPLVFLLHWLSLYGVLIASRRYAELILPRRRVLRRQTAIISLATCALSFIPYVGWLAALVVFCWLLARWFDADLKGKVYVIVLTGLARGLTSMVVLAVIEELRAGS